MSNILEGLQMRLSLILACFLVGFFGCEVARAQFDSDKTNRSIEVHLLVRGKSIFNGQARVRLLSPSGIEIVEGTLDSYGRTTFLGLSPATYVVEASAPGFVTAVETVEVDMRGSDEVFLSMEPEAPRNLALPASDVPILLAPNARKELEKGVEAFGKKNTVEARKYFEKVLSMAPGNPIVQFSIGVLELRENNISAAQDHLEKAVQIFPNYVRALELLGQLYCHQGHPDKGVPLVEKAVSLEDGSWKAHWELGSAYLLANEPAKAQLQAERAIASGKSDAGIAQILDARALIALGKWEEAETILETFIRDQPGDLVVPEARVLLAQARQRESNELEKAPLALSEPRRFDEIADLRPEIVTATDSFRSLPRIDDIVPEVDPHVSCALPQVLAGAGKQVEQLMTDLEKFNATERVSHFTVDKQGHLGSPQTRSFDYVVSVSQKPHGWIDLEEYRNGSLDPGQFPAQVATEGLPAMALVFHPQMISDFDFVCEGLGQASGRPAWQVHFQQRPNHSNSIRDYVVSGNHFPIALKGRAWIDAGTYQVIRLESELVKPIPEIRLQRENLSIDYAPVQFHSRGSQLWLPSHAEMLVSLNGQFFYRTHDFSNFQLFSVSTDQKLGAPRESYSFTNLSDRDVSGQLTVTLLGHSLLPISITFTIPSRQSVYKIVGPGRDLDISPDLIASARFVYAGIPGSIQAEAILTNASTLEIVPESQVRINTQN
jgi:tetratricopeptide (TPR) repeat protein